MKTARWMLFGKCLLACAALTALNGCSTGSQVASAVNSGADRAKELLGQKSDQALTQMNMARLHERKGSPRKALELYEDLHHRFPKDAEVCNRIGVVCTRLEEHEKAQQFFLKALELEPNNAEVLTDFGYALYLNNDLEAAEFTLRKAIEENPDDARAASNLGLVLGELGKFDESLAMFRRCVSEAEAQANLAYIHVRRGEGLLAEQRYSQALSLDSNLAAASQALVQLAEARQGMEARLRMIAAQQQQTQQNLAAAPAPPVGTLLRTRPPASPPYRAQARILAERQPVATPDTAATPPQNFASQSPVSAPIADSGFEPPIRTVSATEPSEAESPFRPSATIHAAHESLDAQTSGRASVTQAGYAGEEPAWAGDSPDVWR